MKCKYEKQNGHCHREALDNSNRGFAFFTKIGIIRTKKKPKKSFIEK